MPPDAFVEHSCPPPPELGGNGFIVEGIVTSLGEGGEPNISPMGPLVDGSFEWLWLRPFRTSRTTDTRC